MYDINLSSNSEDEDQNFQGHYKKVAYEGHISDSDRQDSHEEDSNSEYSKKGKLECRITSNKSSDVFGKSKNIKKNCESAKMSRQRKKLYLDLLEQRSQELKSNIVSRKASIRSISSKIMQKFQGSNREKYNFLTQKLAISKRLIAISNQIQQIKKGQEEATQNQTAHQDSQMEQQLENSNYPSAPQNEAPQMSKGKAKKKKGQNQKHQLQKKEVQEKIQLKQESLSLGINSYMYEFGVRGSLRTDVAERNKCEWFSNVQQTMPPFPQPQAVQSVNRMKLLMGQLQEKSKKLDYSLRELKQRVKQKFVVQFLLDREFFTHHSAETIYKNSQLTNQKN